MKDNTKNETQKTQTPQKLDTNPINNTIDEITQAIRERDEVDEEDNKDSYRLINNYSVDQSKEILISPREGNIQEFTTLPTQDFGSIQTGCESPKYV